MKLHIFNTEYRGSFSPLVGKEYFIDIAETLYSVFLPDTQIKILLAIGGVDEFDDYLVHRMLSEYFAEKNLTLPSRYEWEILNGPVTVPKF